MREDVRKLLDDCIAANQAGQDFPTIWNTILKGHRLVASIPLSEPGPRLVVRLATGDHLLFSNEFSIRQGLGPSW